MRLPFLFLLPALLIPCSGDARAQEPVATQTPAAVQTHPTAAPALEVLRDECVACHRTGKSKGGLKLGTEQGLKAGGESGPVLVAGKPTESLLFSVLSKDGDPHMPPKKQLTAPQIAAVRAWLEAGAPWDAAVMERPPRGKPVKLRPLPASVKPVFALSFSPDGSTLAVARGGHIELRDAPAERCPLKSTILAEVDTVASLLWSHDGKTLVSGGFRQIRFWNATDGSATGAITEGLSGDITALCASGGTLWAADSLASRGGFIHRIAAEERKILQTWKAHEDSVYGLALSTDGLWLASAGADRLMRRWEPLSGALVGTYEGHTNQVLSVAFDPLNPRLATTGADREIKIWDRDSREQDAVLGDKKQVTSALHWSADGSRLASVTDRGGGSVFSAIQKHTGAQSSETAKIQKLEKVAAVLQCVSTNKDGTRIAAGAADGRVFIWNGADGKLVPFE
jgi:mono/diheme cytochrome c family protein